MLYLFEIFGPRLSKDVKVYRMVPLMKKVKTDEGEKEEVVKDAFGDLVLTRVVETAGNDEVKLRTARFLKKYAAEVERLDDYGAIRHFNGGMRWLALQDLGLIAVCISLAVGVYLS